MAVDTSTRPRDGSTRGRWTLCTHPSFLGLTVTQYSSIPLNSPVSRWKFREKNFSQRYAVIRIVGVYDDKALQHNLISVYKYLYSLLRFRGAFSKWLNGNPTVNGTFFLLFINMILWTFLDKSSSPPSNNEATYSNFCWKILKYKKSQQRHNKSIMQNFSCLKPRLTKERYWQSKLLPCPISIRQQKYPHL